MKIIDKNNIPKLKAQIKELTGKKIRVGVLGNAELAVIAGANEFGVPGRIPERAFLRITMDKKDTVSNAVKFAERVFDLNQDTEKMLNAIGASLVSSVQDTIESNIAPPNAEATIKRKGSAKTLQDTGRLKQGITYEIL